MTYEIGKVYYGKHEERRLVIGVDDESVEYVSPGSLTDRSAPIDEFEAWRTDSWRRTYLGADGETRTRIKTRAAVMDEDGKELEPAGMEYVVPDNPADVLFASNEDWATWRAAAT